MEDYLLTKEKIYTILSQKYFALVLTLRDNLIGSRTMEFAMDESHTFYLLTLKKNRKVEDIRKNSEGIIHINQLDEDMLKSYDIQIRGNFRIISDESTDYYKGIETLGKKNPQIAEMFRSEMRNLYHIIGFKAKEITAWNYFMVVNELPKIKINGI